MTGINTPKEFDSNMSIKWVGCDQHQPLFRDNLYGYAFSTGYCQVGPYVISAIYPFVCSIILHSFYLSNFFYLKIMFQFNKRK